MQMDDLDFSIAQLFEDVHASGTKTSERRIQCSTASETGVSL